VLGISASKELQFPQSIGKAANPGLYLHWFLGDVFGRWFRPKKRH